MSELTGPGPAASGTRRPADLAPAAAYVATADAAVRELESSLETRPRSRSMYRALTTDPEAIALWDLANYTTVGKLGYNDHGPLHARLTGATAVRILDLLMASGQVPDVILMELGDHDDSTLVVLTAGMLHDVGNAIHRQDQARNGTLLADPILRHLLPSIYPDVRATTMIRTLILAAINAHDLVVPPLTLGASIVALADAIDVTAGRGQGTADLGRIDIHSLSTLAIDRISVSGGAERPIQIDVEMHSDAGLFQVQETLVRKLLRTPLAGLVGVTACLMDDPGRPTRTIDCIALIEGRLSKIGEPPPRS